MKSQVISKALIGCIVATFALFFSSTALAFDADAAKLLAKKNDCFKCHAIDKTKKGPSYKKIAAKYKGKEAEAETKMTKNMTESPMVELEDGSKEEHKNIEATPAQIKNLIAWIMSM